MSDKPMTNRERAQELMAMAVVVDSFSPLVAQRMREAAQLIIELSGTNHLLEDLLKDDIAQERIEQWIEEDVEYLTRLN